MSFDLAVIHLKEPVTSSEAHRLYIELCEGNVDVVPSEQRVDSFFQELITKNLLRNKEWQGKV